MAAIAAAPLAITGALWAYDLALRLAGAWRRSPLPATGARVAACVLAGGFLVLNFMPEFNLPGLHHQYSAEEVNANKTKEYRDWPKSVHTTFGDYRAMVEDIYSWNAPLDRGERTFLKKVASLVPAGALVVNDPMDGSFLAYGTQGLRVYYRTFTGFGSADETAASKVIRERLSSYATDEEVRKAVEEVDARYVIVLHGSKEESGFIDLRGDYDPSLFSGISSITPETPGFTCLCETAGGMALYRIDR